MPPSSLDSTELPALKSRTQCVLIPRDPNFIYAYWNYSEEDINRARNQLKSESGGPQLILRVYDITLIKFDGANANHTWDIDVGFSTKKWYVHVWQDNADYCAELGVRCGENHFIALARSNIVHTPPKSASKRNDLIWQDIKAHSESRPYIREKSHKAKQPQKAGRVYHLTARDIRDYYMKLFSGVSKKGRKLRGVSWQKVRPLITDPDLIKHTHPGASEGLMGKKGASEGRLNQKKFFFEVWTELLVHGRTEPGATVSLNQQGIKLNPDGTFSLRYALADGEIPLKFIAQSSDGSQQRHINTRIERKKTIDFSRHPERSEGS